jgi:hypothetical protein
MKHEPLNDQRRRMIPRFGIGVLLALTACVASYMAGRKHGFDDARDMWIGLPKIARIYNVHDLVSKKSTQESGTSAAELSELLQSEIWLSGVSTAQSDVKVNAGPMAGTIIIAANDIAHRKTAEILDRLRATRDK